MRRALVLLLILGGCGGSDAPPKPTATAPPERTAAPRATAEATPVATPRPRLTGTRKCGLARCSTLRVPLDRTGARDETLRLKVAVAGKRDAPVFLFLSGGPGEPGVSFLERARKWLGPAASKVRIVAFDQRGTGAAALRCPALQKQMGASDLTPPTRGAVEACARKLGDRRQYFATSDTVDDIEALRIALGVDKLTLDGISYGTFVAQRYALAYPARVSGLVLDSVVPAEGVSLLSKVSIKATRRVLGKAATEDLAKVIREEHNGPQMLDMLTALSVGTPRGDGVVNAIARAADGSSGRLHGYLTGVANAVHRWTTEQLSQGLHASTLCADMPAPWGDASAPVEGRRAALEAEAAKLSDDDLYPYSRETATGNGIALQCLYWPPVRAPAPAPTATCRRFRRCCWPVIATSRRRWSGPGRRPSERRRAA